ncbi:hypothetical protein B0H21DRAFT_710244 [Amylocystis lapponica]|nr:hypothetical protein B0H21DRAFT_710244 [Amylocystis lapponica]
MSESVACLLQVLWAEVDNPSDLDLKKAPNLQVRIHYPDIPKDFRTKRRVHTYKPVWNMTFPSLNVADPSVKLTFTLSHKSSLSFSKITIGVALDLKAPDDIENPHSKLNWILQVKLVKITSSLATALVETVTNINQDVQAIERSFPYVQGVGQAVAVLDASGTLDKALEGLSTKLESIDGIMKTVDGLAKIHPYVDTAWQVLSSFYKIVKIQKDKDQQVVLLVQTMDDTVSFIQEIDLLQNKQAYFQKTLLGIMKQTVECVFFVQGYLGHGFSGRMLRQLNSNDDNIISQMIENFKALKQSLQTSIVFDVTLVSLRMSKKIDILYLKTLLSPYEMDWSNRPECHPDTQKDMLFSIYGHLTIPIVDQKIVWMHGPAGSGKSTISTTIAQYFQSLHHLGAFIFFNRLERTQNSVAAVIRTVAYQLAECDSSFHSALIRVLEQDQSIVRSSLQEQVSELLIKPLASSAKQSLHGPIIIVIDALDEFGDIHQQRQLLDALVKGFEDLPQNCQLFLTSRLEVQIKSVLHKLYVQELSLDITTTSIQEDIQVYLKQQMLLIQQDSTYDLFSFWPEEKAISNLSAQAAGLFIWASTAIQTSSSVLFHTT